MSRKEDYHHKERKEAEKEMLVKPKPSQKLLSLLQREEEAKDTYNLKNYRDVCDQCQYSLYQKECERYSEMQTELKSFISSPNENYYLNSSASKSSILSSELEPLALTSKSSILTSEHEQLALTSKPSILTSELEPLALTSKSSILTSELEPLALTSTSSILTSELEPLALTSKSSILTSELEPLALTSTSSILTSEFEPMALTTTSSILTSEFEPMALTSKSTTLASELEAMASPNSSSTSHRFQNETPTLLKDALTELHSSFSNHQKLEELKESPPSCDLQQAETRQKTSSPEKSVVDKFCCVRECGDHMNPGIYINALKKTAEKKYDFMVAIEEELAEVKEDLYFDFLTTQRIRQLLLKMEMFEQLLKLMKEDVWNLRVRNIENCGLM